MWRTPALLASAVLLSGCNILFPEDPRLGVESAEECAARVVVAGVASPNEDGLVIPTYTYDVTKLGLEGIQSLTTPETDDTAGARLIASTNEISTAMAVFKEMPVTEDGAFFMATDPSLYRVRGEASPMGEIITAGCARQLANMRLLRVEFSSVPEEPGEETDTVNPQDTSLQEEATN